MIGSDIRPYLIPNIHDNLRNGIVQNKRLANTEIDKINLDMTEYYNASLKL